MGNFDLNTFRSKISTRPVLWNSMGGFLVVSFGRVRSYDAISDVSCSKVVVPYPFAKFSRKERYYGNVLAATEVPGQSSAEHGQFRLCWAQ